MSNRRRLLKLADHSYSPQPRSGRISSPFDGRRHKRSYSDVSDYTSSGSVDGTFCSPAKIRRNERVSRSPLFFRPELRITNFPHPMFMRFQLVGDSLLLRFAEHVLHSPACYKDGLRYLGLCVSGQTIQQLTTRVKEKFAPLGEKVILLIGTNNLLQGSDVEIMKTALGDLVNELLKTVKKLVLLTLPPIPKLEQSGRFWYKFKEYNSFLDQLSKQLDNVFLEQITDLFLNGEYDCNMDYFERWYNRQQTRPDRIHLNRSGLHLLSKKLTTCESISNSID